MKLPETEVRVLMERLETQSSVPSATFACGFFKSGSSETPWRLKAPFDLGAALIEANRLGYRTYRAEENDQGRWLWQLRDQAGTISLPFPCASAALAVCRAILILDYKEYMHE